MVSISAVIITYNEERNLARCLESLKDVADEIIIADSFSTDDTGKIALSYNATVAQHPFTGYGEQKNFATSLATHHWILSLDADEVLSHELKASIIGIKQQQQYDVYEMPRLTNYCGKWIKHCGWYPDRQTRLYDRTKGRWQEQKVHEYWQHNDPNAKKGLLKGDLLHYSFTSISQHLKKIDKYTELAARAAVEQGKNAGIFTVWGSPGWHFFTEYFIKLGFLDGFYGLIICRLSAYASFLKYSRIRLYAKQQRM